MFFCGSLAFGLIIDRKKGSNAVPPKLSQFNVADSQKAILRVWIARLLIGAVAGFSLQAAVSFLLSPQDFVYAYELSGAAGEAAVRSAGVLFAVWNVPYLFAVFDPARYRLGLYFAALMQSIALLGGIYIFIHLPAENEVLSATMTRFIVFAAGGWILLLAAYQLVKGALPHLYSGWHNSTPGGRRLLNENASKGE